MRFATRGSILVGSTLKAWRRPPNAVRPDSPNNRGRRAAGRAISTTLVATRLLLGLTPSTGCLSGALGFQTVAALTAAPDPLRRSDWALEWMSVPRDAGNDRILRCLRLAVADAETRLTAGHLAESKRFRPAPENRGVPGSSPGLAIRSTTPFPAP